MSLSSANTASHFWLLSNSTALYKTTQALSRAFFVTVDFLSKPESNLVHRTGDETISGKKIFNTGPDFTSDIYIKGETEINDSPYIDFQPRQVLSKGDTPSHKYSSGLMVYDSESTSEGAHEFAGLTFSVGTNNVVKAELYTNKNVADDRSMNKIVVVSPQSGEPYATAPNTRSTPSANEIITYDFLQQYVEANGGGNVIWSGSAGADQLTYSCSNGSYNEWRMTTINIRITAPAGGTWLIWGTPVIEFLLSGASSSYDGAVQYAIPYWPRTYTSTYKTRYPAGSNTETINVSNDIIIVPGGTNIFNQAVSVASMTPEYTSTGGIKQWRVNHSNVACIKLA